MDVLQIEILDDIGGWGFTLKDLIDKLKGFKGNKITVPVNSFGGSVLEGLAIYNTLKGRTEEVETRVVGYALSMGSVIACAGDRCTMPENGYVMIHNPWGVGIGDGLEMERTAELLYSMKAQLVEIYHNKTGLDKEEISALMDAETWLTAQEALDKGFVDELTQGVEIQASFKKETLSQFQNVPDQIANQFSFNKSKSFTMDLKNFLASIIPGLQKAFGLNIDENTSPEDVVKAINEAPSIESIKAELKTELEAGFSNKVTESIKALGFEIGEDGKVVAPGGDSQGSEDERFKALEDKISALEKSKGDLEGELATLKGEGGDGGRQTSANPQSKTVQSFNVTLGNISPGNGSKYRAK